MKKNFWKLLIIFGVLLCIFAFYGCGEEAETTLQSSETTSAEAMESTSETDETTEKVKETTSAAEITTEAEETSVETTETEEKTVETSEIEETSAQTEETSSETESLTESVETTEITSEESSETEETVEETTEDPFAIEDELISELVEYLHSLNSFHNMPSKTVEDKIDEIKGGSQPLLVTFDSTTDYYFMCGYFNPEHDREDFSYCCAEKYTWVRFDKEDEIQEYYNGEKNIVAFQVNAALLITDILPGDKAVPDMEHFQLYEPEYVDGLNINIPITFEKTFIYLNSSNKKTIYYSTDVYYHMLISLRCICFEDQYYIPYKLYSTYNDMKSEVDWEYLEEDFGEYYDVLINITITENYGITDKYGVTIFYGLIPIDDFANKVLK